MEHPILIFLEATIVSLTQSQRFSSCQFCQPCLPAWSQWPARPPRPTTVRPPAPPPTPPSHAPCQWSPPSTRPGPTPPQPRGPPVSASCPRRPSRRRPPCRLSTQMCTPSSVPETAARCRRQLPSCWKTAKKKMVPAAAVVAVVRLVGYRCTHVTRQLFPNQLRECPCVKRYFAQLPMLNIYVLCMTTSSFGILFGTYFSILKVHSEVHFEMYFLSLIPCCYAINSTTNVYIIDISLLTYSCLH